ILVRPRRPTAPLPGGTCHLRAEHRRFDGRNAEVQVQAKREVRCLSAVGALQLLKHNGLLCGDLLWHQSSMAKKSKNAAAVALGRLGGLKGGKARAKRLTPEERTA